MSKAMANVLLKYLKEWPMKTPKQKWQFIHKCGDLVANSIGVTVFTSMDIYWYSFLPEVTVFLYFITASYTVWFYFKQDEYLRGLQVTCGVGIVIAVSQLKIFI